MAGSAGHSAGSTPKRSLRDHPWLAIIALVASLATISTFVWKIVDAVGADSRQLPGGGSTSVQSAPHQPTGNPSSRGGPGTSSSTSSVRTGMCANAAFAVVDCGVAHRYEVAQDVNQPCTSKAITQYLGGNPDIDIPFVSWQLITLGSSKACAVSSISNPQVVGSVKDVLSTSDADGFRRCRDTLLVTKDVACNVAHTGEYVGVPSGMVPNQAQCSAAAETYMNTTLQRTFPSLVVDALTPVDVSDPRPRCLISVRGDNVLLASLRNLGPKTVPEQPRQ